MQEKRN